MKTGRELISAIEQITPLEWAKYPIYKEVPRTATVVWRFKTCISQEDQQRIIDLLRIALEQVATIPWALEFTGRNWVLYTEKASQLVKSGKFRTHGEIDNYIFQEEPELFLKARDDLFNIAEAFGKLVLED